MQILTGSAFWLQDCPKKAPGHPHYSTLFLLFSSKPAYQQLDSDPPAMTRCFEHFFSFTAGRQFFQGRRRPESRLFLECQLFQFRTAEVETPCMQLAAIVENLQAAVTPLHHPPIRAVECCASWQRVLSGRLLVWTIKGRAL